MLKDTAVQSCLIHIIMSWGLGVGYIGHDEIQYCTKKLNGWTGGTENCAEGHYGTSHDVPLRPLGTEGWDGQVGQRTVLRDTMGRPLMSHMSLGD